ncbi:MAG TPA: adenylate/guanylate cyclase domain-containing protein [Actinomycetota bacterium]|nr:adenylate/guanylate cyclase domain-containing protein [Actinomycetota bacterium]
MDLVYPRALAGDLVSTWEQPLLVRHIQALASFSRVLLFDKRGTGLSDRVREVPTLEARMDDVRAVMDDAGSEAAVLWTGSEATRPAVLFAATYPERTLGLSLLDPSAKGRPSPDYPWAPTDEEWRRTIAEVREGWGTRAFLEALCREWAPTMAENEGFREWFVWHARRSLSPGAAVAFYRMIRDSDVSEVLPSVRAPTLILHRPSERGPAGFFGRRIPDARVVEIPGMVGVFTWVDDGWHEVAMRETRDLVARASGPREPDRLLATVLFVDVVGSTARLAAVGDRAWGDLLGRYHAVARRETGRFGGRELDAVGDGFLAAFDGPARAIRCAWAIRDAVRELGLEVRAGLHAGECEARGGKLVGVAVHVGARVAALAEAGEVLASRTVRDLVAGSGIGFEDRGDHALKGVPGTWRLYAVASA